MKPYQDHEPVADQGKAEPHPKQPNKPSRKRRYFYSGEATWKHPIEERRRPTRSVRRAMKRANREHRVTANTKARNKHRSLQTRVQTNN